MSEADPALCPIRAIFSKTVFPARLDPTAQTYPFFKDYEKCFKTQERFLGYLRRVKWGASSRDTKVRNVDIEQIRAQSFLFLL